MTLIFVAAFAVAFVLILYSNWVGGALALAGSVYGAHKDEQAWDKHSKASAADRAAALKYLGTGRGKYESQMQMAQMYLQERLAEADRAIATAGAGAHRDIRATHQQTSAKASQAMAQRGMGGTTAAMAAQRNVAAGTAQSMGSFWDQFAQTRQQHALGAAGMLSGFYGGWGEAQYGQQVDAANVYLGQRAAPSQGQAAHWGQIGAQLGKGIGDWWGSRGQDDYGAGGKYEGYHETGAGPMGPKYEG